MSSNKKIRIFNEATAIVTGGASGIDRALARELAKRGCEVVLADRQIQFAEAEEFRKKKLSGEKVDYGDATEKLHLFRTANSIYGLLSFGNNMSVNNMS